MRHAKSLRSLCQLKVTGLLEPKTVAIHTMVVPIRILISMTDKNPYPHDRRADKDSYPHNSNNQCIILRLQLSFVMINMINVQLIVV